MPGELALVASAGRVGHAKRVKDTEKLKMGAVPRMFLDEFGFCGSFQERRDVVRVHNVVRFECRRSGYPRMARTSRLKIRFKTLQEGFV